MNNKFIFVKNLGLKNWIEVYNSMNSFTTLRNHNTYDEIWFVEHYPIFTQGVIKKAHSIKYIHQISSNFIPIVSTNRGGQITYHGPGQQIVYFLINLKRRKINIRQFVNFMHMLIIDTLNYFSIKSNLIEHSPGVYINKKKVCSFGLRISKGCTLHGLSLNIDMDLTPFNYIYPCGDVNIKMTQVKYFNSYITLSDIRLVLIKNISKLLNTKIINKFI